MPRICFTKGVALGNDFIIIDARKTSITLTSEQIQKLANRREGVGCDQLILILPSTEPQAYARLVFYNADGTQAEACGNGTRCVGRLLMEEAATKFLCLQIGSTLCHASWQGGEAGISITMGKPRFAWDHIPLAHPDALKEVVHNAQTPFSVNIGNPHAVFFVNNVDDISLTQIGPEIETHPAFPLRVNVGFAKVVDAHTLQLRVWERGAGVTRACGTGACAAGVVAIHENLAFSSSQHPIRVIQEGGESLIHWEEGQDIILTGPAQITFQGEIQV